MSLVKLMLMLSAFHATAMEEMMQDALPPVQEVGVASWYGSGNGDNGMHGKYTASGEVFDPSRQTCASRTIPLHTYILVEDAKTGRRAWCRVNDRGPYGATLFDGTWGIMVPRKTGYLVRRRVGNAWATPMLFEGPKPGKYRRVLDLSYGTAQALGFDTQAGVGEVIIRYYDVQGHGALLSLVLRPFLDRGPAK